MIFLAIVKFFTSHLTSEPHSAFYQQEQREIKAIFFPYREPIKLIGLNFLKICSFVCLILIWIIILIENVIFLPCLFSPLHLTSISWIPSKPHHANINNIYSTGINKKWNFNHYMVNFIINFNLLVIFSVQNSTPTSLSLVESINVVSKLHRIQFGLRIALLEFKFLLPPFT